MRKHQVTITIESFENDKHQVITAYADANNIHEALNSANYEVLKQVEKTTDIPSFGVSNSNLVVTELQR